MIYLLKKWIHFCFRCIFTIFSDLPKRKEKKKSAKIRNTQKQNKTNKRQENRTNSSKFPFNSFNFSFCPATIFSACVANGPMTCTNDEASFALLALKKYYLSAFQLHPQVSNTMMWNKRKNTQKDNKYSI